MEEEDICFIFNSHCYDKNDCTVFIIVSSPYTYDDNCSFVVCHFHVCGGITLL